MTGIVPDPEHSQDGVSLVPLLTGGELHREAIYLHFPHYSNHGLQSPGGAIRAGDYKLLEYFEHGTVQLFNLRTDPAEQVDLAGAEPERAAKLRFMLHKWRKSISAQMMAPNPGYSAAAAQ
jgi:arylsulfatase A-like enzyme